MRKRLIAVLYGLIIFSAFLVPVSGNAQGLAPNCGVPSAGQPYCELCHVVQLIDRIIDFIIIDFSWPVAAILFAYAGFLYITSRGSGQIETAKRIFVDVALGFIIILGAWLLIDAIMQTLVGNRLGFPWNSIQCIGQPPQTAGSQGGSSSPPPGNVTPVTVDPGELTRAQALAQLNPGIALNHPVANGDCPAGQTTGCTSLTGVKTTTIAAANFIQSSCSCPVVISGGTEGGHAPGQFSHANGFKLDFQAGRGSQTAALDSFLTQTIQNNGLLAQTNGTLQQDHPYGPIALPNGSTLTIRRESIGTSNDHWDVQVVPPTG